jgi:hypothetical protein
MALRGSVQLKAYKDLQVLRDLLDQQDLLVDQQDRLDLKDLLVHLVDQLDQQEQKDQRVQLDL